MSAARAWRRGVCLVWLAVPAWPLAAWPTALAECVARDARRLVPRTLAQLLHERETDFLAAAQRLPPKLSQVLFADLWAGSLQATTLQALALHGAEPVRLIKERRAGEGLVRLGALMRVPADLSDPVVTAGAPDFAPGLAREYYAFVAANLKKLPVTLHDGEALKTLSRADLPDYWQRLQRESRAQAGVLRSEMLRQGRVVDHRRIDYRSPVFAVAQISYSRAVTAVAATWIALWREARGDLTRMPVPALVNPVDRGPVPPNPPPSEGVPPPEPAGRKRP